MVKVLKIFLLLLFIALTKPVSAVKVDSAYVYSQQYNSDSSRIFLVAQVRVSSQPCSLQDTNIIHGIDSIQINLCYIGGTALVFCYRTDTLDLGVKKNDVIHVLAIFKESYNGQCTGTSFYKDSFDFTINTTSSSVYEIDDYQNISLSPNPTKNTLTIQTNTTGNLTYQVLATDGRTLIQNKTTNPNFEIDVSTLPAGLYFLQLQNNRNRWVKKFVKQ